MIGKSLTKAQMVALLNNMGTIDQPWVSSSFDTSDIDALLTFQNCPHGRPTMRHLTKLNSANIPGHSTDRIDWSSWSSNS